jgi:hypothetical protein
MYRLVKEKVGKGIYEKRGQRKYCNVKKREEIKGRGTTISLTNRREKEGSE